jgi:hypothetical protein
MATRKTEAPAVRCAVYTRKSTEEGLEQEFNSLDAQREAGEAFIASQRGEGWTCLPDRYDDGGYTGGNMERPAFRRLMADVEAGLVDCIVVYKVDRLSRSLLDFTRIMEILDRRGVSFVWVRDIEEGWGQTAERGMTAEVLVRAFRDGTCDTLNGFAGPGRRMRVTVGGGHESVWLAKAICVHEGFWAYSMRVGGRRWVSTPEETVTSDRDLFPAIRPHSILWVEVRLLGLK